MRVNRGIKHAIKKAIPVLLHRHGVYASIYEPKSHKSLKHGFMDDNVEYKKECRSLKVLIPSFFRKGVNTLSDTVLDPFSDEGDIFMYVPLNINLLNYSKVVTYASKGIKNYIITHTDSYKDDADILFFKHVLVPSPSIDIEKNKDEIECIIENDDLPPYQESLVAKPVIGGEYTIDRL